MGYIACFGNSIPPISINTKFRFLKWHITKTKSTADHVQMSEIKLLDSDNNEYDFTNASGTISHGSIVDGSFTNLFDNKTNTKACISWAKDYIDIEIDVGASKTVDFSRYNRFVWYTANDMEMRDPSSWILYGANMSDFSDAVILNQVVGFMAPATRMVLAYDDAITVTTGTSPIFTETLIADNTSEATSFTFDEDYHHYPILKIKTHNDDSEENYYFFTTPAAIDHAFTIAQRFTVNEYESIQYGTYSQSDLTWTRTNSRNVHIVNVYGLTCSMKIQETEIYKATELSSSDISITYTDKPLGSFDMIFVTANSDDYTEILPCKNIIFPNSYGLNGYVFDGRARLNAYWNSGSTITITDTSMGGFKYFYVSGIKFS